MKLKSILVITLLIAITLTACQGAETPTPQPAPPAAPEAPIPEPEPEPTISEEPEQPEIMEIIETPPQAIELDLAPYEYTFEQDIVLGNFVLTFHNNVEWLSITDEDSIYYGVHVIRVPVSVLNISHTNQDPSTIDMFTLESPIAPLDNISEYFMDYDIAGARTLTMGSTANTHVHFLYDGSGIYSVIFDFGDWEMPVRLPISR